MANITPSEKMLGRIIVEDERDKKFLMSSVIPATSTRKYRYWWSGGWWGDQGRTSQCVAFSWLHWLEDGPVTQSKVPPPCINPTELYDDCQNNDQWPGSGYAGTSVRAGAKVLKRRGYVDGYKWAWDADTAVRALLEAGPLVIGTWWYYDMFFPKIKGNKGYITATGNKVGGHAYLLNGVNTKLGFVRIKNSWGRLWSRNGYAYMSIEDLDKLIKEDGEACLAIEKKAD